MSQAGAISQRNSGSELTIDTAEQIGNFWRCQFLADPQSIDASWEFG
jgi:hypothetical protein